MTRRRDPNPPSPEVALLAAILTNHRATPDGLCVGQAPAWDLDPLPGEDPAQHADRLLTARQSCQRCPARPGCPSPIGRAPRAGQGVRPGP